MPFSFNPGQEQTGAPQAAPVPQSSNNGVPVLNVPVAPQISLTPVVEAVSPFAYKNRGKSKFSIYFQSAIFLLFAVISIAAIGLFFYQTILKSQISSRQAKLVEIQGGFKKPNIEEMQRLSSRLALINKIVKERVSVLTALTVVEETVNPEVHYTKFTLSKDKNSSGYDMAFEGQTNSYTALYQQLEIINAKEFSPYLQKINIAGISPLDKKGLVNFKVYAKATMPGIDYDGFTVIHKASQASSTNETSSTTSMLPGNSEETSSSVKRLP